MRESSWTADNGVLWVDRLRVFGRRKKEKFLNLDY